MIDEIEQETGLPIDLEEVYQWMAFVASRENPSWWILNRFFGLRQDGTYKILWSCCKGEKIQQNLFLT